MPVENQNPGSESGEPELRTCDPQTNDAERPVNTPDVPAMESCPDTDMNMNPEVEGLATPTPAG